MKNISRDRDSFSLPEFLAYASISGAMRPFTRANRYSIVVVVAACNHPKMVDAAILRAGRLDRHVMISLPDSRAREAIFRMHLLGGLSEDDHRAFAEATEGLSGAEIERIV